MAILSGASVRDRMSLGSIEITSNVGETHQPVPISHVKGHTVDLSLGRYIGELNPAMLMESLKNVSYLDRADYLMYGGLNPEKDRESIEKSTVILDLMKLEDYFVEKEGRGDNGCYSYKVKTKDGMHTFATRITKEKEADSAASGVIYHPESFHLIEKTRDIREIVRCLADNMATVERCLSSKRSKKGFQSELESLRLGLRTLDRKIRYPVYDIPSTSFNIGWTDECVKVPKDIVAYVHTKSKFARLGLSTNMTSDKIDPGFCNYIALEFKNEGPYPVHLGLKQPVAEIEFSELDLAEPDGYNDRKCSIYKKDKLTF
jgi:deoxycytidine triphosphate deaminase